MAMDEYNYRNFVTEISRIRDKLGDILTYDWVPMPLALTQVRHFYWSICSSATYFNFRESLSVAIISLIMRFAFSLVLNIFYLGWLKCSQVILNPFGEDDDDYEVISNFVILLHSPVLPQSLGFSRLSDTSLIGSMAGKRVPQHEQEVVNHP
uniref:Bestrophin homolog n=1 Tax=Heterorhabditis bacteriophora TaxID=37862 RepID=A0A1I7XRR3_HETBA